MQDETGADAAGPERKAKSGYKDKKLEGRLRKYEAILRASEGIERVQGPSQYLFVGNCGLDNNISYDFLVETFGAFGHVIDVVMPARKSYAFVIFEEALSAQSAIDALQATVITSNQTPICFYLFPVDRVPDSSGGQEELGRLPDGLVYLEDFVDAEFVGQLLDAIQIDNYQSLVGLKNRQVKHYGFEFRYGSNDCDLTQPLLDSPIPAVCEALCDRLLGAGLVQARPDQMTVNVYEPGAGIPPHVDNTEAFEDFIISLSLLSGVIMEFRSPENQLARLLLKPNSLLILKGDARYRWTHGIAERKHDLVRDDEGHTRVLKRAKRVSLTFRKIRPARQKSEQEKEAQKQATSTTMTPTTTTKTASEAEAEKKVELVLPVSEQQARDFEKTYVHSIYNDIADHFSTTRHKPWPGVVKFIESMAPYSAMLDIGCGNGKYLSLRNDVLAFGCDYSDQLINICQGRNFKCFVSDCLNLSVKKDFFDYAICIAVLHHLSTLERRVSALKEIRRVLKPGGRALVTVWAKEQKYKDKESFYINSKKSAKKQPAEAPIDPKAAEPSSSSSTAPEKPSVDENVHKFGKEFEKKDVFVAWHYKPKPAKKDKKEAAKTTASAEAVVEETKSETTPEGKVYLRFYHVFENQELEELFQHVPGVRIVESFYEEGNWCVVFERI